MRLLPTSLAVLAGVAMTAAPARAEYLLSQPASTYRDSIGVNVHVQWGGGTTYGDIPASALANNLRTLGIRHVRDGACLPPEPQCPTQATKLATLRDAFGASGPLVKLSAIVSGGALSTTDRAARRANLHAQLDWLATNLPTMVAGVENFNEPDLPAKNPPAGWQSTIAADQADLQTALAARPAISGAARLTPSLVNADQWAVVRSQPTWVPGSATTGNVHPYSGELHPESAGVGINLTHSSCSGFSITPLVKCAETLTGNSTTWATEAGFTNSSSSGAHVDAQKTGQYVLRQLLDNFARGVSRTYLYQLLDDKATWEYYNYRDAGYGLYTVNRTFDYGLWRLKYSLGAAKPAAQAIANSNTIIGDLNAGVPASSALELAATVGGIPTSCAASPGNGPQLLRCLLLRRANGTRVLAVWRPVAFGTAATPVNLTLGAAGQSFTVRRYEPMVSSAVQETFTAARTVALNLGSAPMLLDIG